MTRSASYISLAGVSWEEGFGVLVQGFWESIHSRKEQPQPAWQGDDTRLVMYVFDSHWSDSADAFDKACVISLAVVICAMVFV